MLKLKITICSLLAAALIVTGAVIHHGLKQERFHYDMRPPIPDGSYRIYNDFEPESDGVSYSPYQPREYVRIIRQQREGQRQPQ